MTLWLFVLAQTFDGLFTYAAVCAYGLVAEGNLLLATWMGLLGPGVALTAAKSMATACGIFLYGVGKRGVLLALTVGYATFAIIPWLIVFRQTQYL